MGGEETGMLVDQRKPSTALSPGRLQLEPRVSASWLVGVSGAVEGMGTECGIHVLEVIWVILSLPDGGIHSPWLAPIL